MVPPLAPSFSVRRGHYSCALRRERGLASARPLAVAFRAQKPCFCRAFSLVKIGCKFWGGTVSISIGRALVLYLPEKAAPQGRLFRGRKFWGSAVSIE